MRLTAMVVSLVLVGALASSCSDDDPEPIMPSNEDSTSSAAPDDQPSDDETAMSPRQAVKQAPQRWLDADVEARRTRSTAGLRALSAPECDVCDSKIEGLEEVWSEGGWIRGGREVVLSVRILRLRENFARVQIRKRSPEFRRKSFAGAGVQKWPPETSEFVFEFKRDGDDWLITRMGPVG